MYRIEIGIESMFLKKKLELGLGRGKLVINPPELDLIFKTTTRSKIRILVFLKNLNHPEASSQFHLCVELEPKPELFKFIF
jgi:hypothetical protein